ncbi:MAG: hypothetical protein ABJE95_05005 [Byssovorax sp.]
MASRPSIFAAALLLSVALAACGEAAPRVNDPVPVALPYPVPGPLSAPVVPSALVQASPYPPAVLMGDVELHCTISSKERGRQTLVARAGTALEFDAVVSPIVDGEVETHGEKKGGMYRFTSHLAEPATGKLGNIGEVKLDELETRVTVEMNRYNQPKGAGAPFSFTSVDMRQGGVYVEFVGKATAKNGDHYAFRVNLGAPTGGSGEVTPGGPGEHEQIYSKMVMVQAPTITVVSQVTVQRVP